MSESLDWFENDDGEEVIWEGKPHINSIYPIVAIGIPLTLIGVGPFLIAFAYLDRENKEFLVTDQGVYRKSGIISRRVKKISFDKIQDTSYSKGYFGRMFDYGNLDITTAGGSQVEMRFQSIPSPEEVQKQVNRFIRDDKESAERSEKDLLKEILQELKDIKEKV